MESRWWLSQRGRLRRRRCSARMGQRRLGTFAGAAALGLAHEHSQLVAALGQRVLQLFRCVHRQDLGAARGEEGLHVVCGGAHA